MLKKYSYKLYYKSYFYMILILFLYMVFSYYLNEIDLFYIISLIIYILCLGAVLTKFRLVSPVFIFLFSGGLYTFSPALDIYVFNGVRYDPKLSMLPTILTVTFIALYTIFVLMDRRLKDIYINEIKCDKRGYKFYYKGVIALTFLFYMYSIYNAYGSIYPNIGRAELYFNKTTMLQIAKIIHPVSMAMYIIMLGSRFKKNDVIFIMIIALAYLFQEVLILGDRRFAVVFVIIFVQYISTVKAFRLLYIPIIIVAIVIFISIGFYRNSHHGFQIKIENILNFSKIEFGYPSEIVQKIQEDDRDGLLNFSILDLPYQMVPRFLIEERPFAPSQSYSRDFFPEIFDSGGAFGYNLIFEFYQNFYILGPIVAALVFWNLTRVMLVGYNYKKVIFFIIFEFSVIFCYRLDIISFLKQSIVIYIFCNFIIWGDIIFRRFKHRWTPPETP